MTANDDTSARRRLAIDLIGPGRISLDGRPLELRSRKAAALIYYLAAHAGDVVTREHLCDLLWSRVEGDQARSSLRQALSQIRRAMPEGLTILQSDPAGVTLDPSGARVDLVELSHGDTAPTGEGFLTGLPSLGEPFDDWRSREGARVLDQVAATGRRSLGRAIEARDVDRALEIGERLLAADPADEETHARLIRFHLDRGALGAALKQYERCRRALKTELDVPPSDAVEALHQEIRDRQGARVEAAPSAAPPDAAGDPGGLPMVAVRGFTSLGTDAEDMAFARIFSGELIQEISRFRGLRVIAAHSLEAAEAAGWETVEAARRLGARYILGGSVRRVDGAIRIAAEIADAGNGQVIWTQRFADSMSELPALEEEMSRAVAGALAVRVDEALLREARPKPIANLNAYDCWLRGLDLLRSGRVTAHDEARLLFKRALEIDPRFPRAYAGLSLTHFNQWSCHAWADWPMNERFAYEYASIGVDLDDSDHITQFILGRILLYRRDYARAEQHLRRAEMLNPNDADTLVNIALGLCYLGDHAGGMALAERAMRLNPFHDDWYFIFVTAPALMLRRYALSAGYARRMPEIATDQSAFLAIAEAHLGHDLEARRATARFRDAFIQNITFGRAPDPDEPARWFFHINPFRLPEDRAFLADGLRAAGLTVPGDLVR